MSRYRHSKSGLFLMELLFNLLLFCLLCGCALMFFIKSDNTSETSTTLHHAVSITSSIASIYEQSDGRMSSLCETFEYSDIEGDCLYIYYDREYLPCDKEDSEYYVIASSLDTVPDKINIAFYDYKENVIYSIVACHYTPTTLDKAEEVFLP